MITSTPTFARIVARKTVQFGETHCLSWCIDFTVDIIMAKGRQFRENISFDEICVFLMDCKKHG
jgi:hypothetical protein